MSGRLILNGDLDLNGSVLLNPAAGVHGPMGVGYYRLITYSGALSGVGLSKPVLWQDAPEGFDPPPDLRENRRSRIAIDTLRPPGKNSDFEQLRHLDQQLRACDEWFLSLVKAVFFQQGVRMGD